MKKVFALLACLFLGLNSYVYAQRALPATDDVPETGSALYCPQLSQTLKRGMRDASTYPTGQVSELQNFLADYFSLDEQEIVTGFFGRATQTYIAKFQQTYNLPAFGIAGTLTRQKIAEVCKGDAPYVPACNNYPKPFCAPNQQLVETGKDYRGCPMTARCEDISTQGLKASLEDPTGRGKESFKIGEQLVVKWSASDIADLDLTGNYLSSVGLSMQGKEQDGQRTLGRMRETGQFPNVYTWNVASADMYGTPLPPGRYWVEVNVYSKRQGGYKGVRAGVIGIETTPEPAPTIAFEMSPNQSFDMTQPLTFPVRYSGVKPGSWICVSLTQNDKDYYSFPMGKNECDKVYTTSGTLPVSGKTITSTPAGLFHAKAEVYYTPTGIWGGGFPHAVTLSQWFTLVSGPAQTWPGLTFTATQRTENTFDFTFDPAQWTTGYGFKIDYGDGETMSLCTVQYGCHSFDGMTKTTTIHGFTNPGSHTVTLYALQPNGMQTVARTVTVVSSGNPVSNDVNTIRINAPSAGSVISLDSYVPVTVSGSVSRKAYGMIMVYKKVNGSWKQQTGMWPITTASDSFGPGQFFINVQNVVMSTNPALSEPATPGEWGIAAEMYTYGCGGYDCSPPTNRVLGTTEIVPIQLR